MINTFNLLQAKKYTPLMVACTIGDDVALTIKLLLESGVNQNGNSEVRIDMH
jgi:hypothetical protein